MTLDAVRVVDLTRLLPGPYATQLLADLGADVIKVEDPDRGDYARHLPPFTEDGAGAIFEAVNRGKRSVALDLKADDQREALLRLVQDADVLIESFRPGVADRLGVGYEIVRDRNPDIVYCSLSGYGQDGPYRDHAGHDLGYVGLAGLLDVTRSDTEERPRIPGYPVADMAGGLFAAFAIVSALLDRELGDGGGTYLDCSLSDAALSFSQAVAFPALSGDDPRPGDGLLTGGYPWYNVYETADDRYVTLSALEPTFWRAFCEAIDRSDLVSLHGTIDEAEQAALREELEAIFVDRPRDEWVEFAEPEIPIAPVLTPAEALHHPQFADRELVRRGESPAILSPVSAASDAPAMVPDHGEHTRSILESAGYDDAAIDALLEE
ncbi:CaiB/BaiF CoA transferase family protein [Halosolutus gelatinilyticus]|uniref:CaiB/BaiF CoA transferase family protein n=1 Tax=Halosolutus gelatinilyticus TaxID=2931975 RepID=UPI001FF30AFD|nr:CaiB/BaiF CoA-transferase family protein [Halosolutus gelatinilyticus]